MSESIAKTPSSSHGSWSGDLWGGLASTLVALPSAIAFGVLVYTAIGPEHAGAGAMAGALGAAALGLVAPLVGRNGGFITAPCAPAAAVMSGFAAHLAIDVGLPMDRVVALMAIAALLSAAFQIGFGLLRLGRFMKYIPYQVVSGYLSGVAVIIAVGQIPKLFGVPSRIGFFEGLVSPELWRWPGMVVGAMTIVVTVVAPLLTKKVPAAILGLAAGIGSYFGIALLRPELLEVTGNPLVIGPIDASGSIRDVVSRAAGSFAQVNLGDLQMVVATAFTLSALLSIDTLKTGVVLDVLTRRRHNSNRELIAQGAANALAAFTGGMPGAGTMGPTLVNVTSGGRSPLSGVASGLFAATAFLALRSAIAWVPIGALAGILLVVAFRMFDWKLFRLLLRRGTRLDFAIIMSVIVVAKAVGLIEASVVGVVLSILLFIRAQMRGSVIVNKRDLREVASKTHRLSEVRRLLDEHGGQAILVELQDDLFFGTTDQVLSDLMEDLQTRRFVLLDLRMVQSMDYTAGQLFRQMIERLAERDGRLLLSGIPSTSGDQQDFERYLTELGLLDADHQIAIHETRNDALEWMENQVLESIGYEDHHEDPPLELRDVELFREFDEDALAALSDIGDYVHLAAGERLFAHGDEGDALYLILRGAVDILLPLPEGLRHHVATVSRGDYFGEMSFLDKGHRSADADAKTDTDLFSLSRSRFNTVARQDAVIATKVFARLALLVSRRLRTANAEVRSLERR
jgi:sulfate permease, SulP family